MDVVLGVSLAPSAVGVVLLEGEGAGAVTVDQEIFDVGPEPAPAAAADQVIAAILGTRQSAAESGHQLQSSGVAWTDPVGAAALRDALAVHKVENVMLVSAFAAAAALAQSNGSATGCARTALLFVEPRTATLAVVSTSDGSIADVQRQPLPEGGDLLPKLTAMVSGVEAMKSRPQRVFLVGSGPNILDISSIKPALEASTSLALTAPEEPDMALARGAALASANASLGAPPTVAVDRAEGPGVGELAYSAVPEADFEFADDLRERRSRRPMLAAAGALAIFVGGVVALAVALALDIRPHVEERPSISKNVVAPATQAPALTPVKPLAPAPLPPSVAPPPPSAVPAPPTEVPPAPPEQVPPERRLPELPRERRGRLGHSILVP